MVKRLSVVWFLLGLALLASSCPNSGEPENTNTNTEGSGTTSTAPTTTTAQATGGNWTGDAFDFMYTSFSGGQNKASTFAGKPLVVNFWAAW